MRFRSRPQHGAFDLRFPLAPVGSALNMLCPLLLRRRILSFSRLSRLQDLVNRAPVSLPWRSQMLYLERALGWGHADRAPRKEVVGLIKHDQLFVGGRWAKPISTQQLTVTSPATEDVIATVPLGTIADVDAAVAAARKAFDEGPWPRMTVDDRRALIRKFGRALGQDVDSLSRLISSDTGQLFRYRHGNVAPAFDYYSSLNLPEPEYRVAPDGAAALIVHEPVGVVAAVMPWNAPMGLTLHSILPALLAGCPVVIKPPRETPL
jgi:Aldehyde dehydrogenase family